MGVGRDIGDAIAGLDAELLQHRRPAVAALEELRVREALRAIYDSLAVGI
jgi:hypothetical protein